MSGPAGPQNPGVPPREAFLLLSFGGPEKPEDVLPFLENVTRGRGIPRERLLEVARHYEQLGGKSPINDHCRALIAALEPAFAAAGLDLPIYWGNRNWHPMLAETVARMRSDGITRAYVLTTSSFSSYSSCRQYLENLEAVTAADSSLRFEKLRQYWNHPGFLEAVIDRTRAAISSVPPERRAKTELVFTAHSIPTAMAATSRYDAQLAEAARLVAAAVGDMAYSRCFQSRSGPPAVPWLEPDVLDHLQAVRARGIGDVVVVPIGFTSDHVEVVWDLDHAAADRARELGLSFHRAATVGTHPSFIAAIVDLVRERREGRAERPVLGTLPPEADVCAPDCCAYAARRPPA